jgi:hypothetical protein
MSIFYSSCKEFNINKEIGFSNLLDTVLHQQKEVLNQLDSVKLNMVIKACEDRVELLETTEKNKLQEQWLMEEISTYVNIKTMFKQMRKELHFLKLEFTYSSKQIQSLKQDLVHRHLSKEEFYGYFTQEHESLAELSKSTKNINKLYHKEIMKFNALDLRLREVFTQIKSLKTKNTDDLK